MCAAYLNGTCCVFIAFPCGKNNRRIRETGIMGGLIEGHPKTPGPSQHYRIDRFKGCLHSGPHYAEIMRAIIKNYRGFNYFQSGSYVAVMNNKKKYSVFFRQGRVKWSHAK